MFCRSNSISISRNGWLKRSWAMREKESAIGRERERERGGQESDERGNGGALSPSSTKTTTATLAGRQEQRSNNPV